MQEILIEKSGGVPVSRRCARRGRRLGKSRGFVRAAARRRLGRARAHERRRLRCDLARDDRSVPLAERRRGEFRDQRLRRDAGHRFAAARASAGTRAMTAWTTRLSYAELTPRERIASIVDDATFREILTPFERASSPYLAVQGIVPQSDDGVVIGRARVEGRDFAIAAIDGRFLGGSLGEIGGAKIASMLELAVGWCAPIVRYWRHPLARGQPRVARRRGNLRRDRRAARSRAGHRGHRRPSRLLRRHERLGIALQLRRHERSGALRPQRPGSRRTRSGRPRTRFARPPVDLARDRRHPARRTRVR